MTQAIEQVLDYPPTPSGEEAPWTVEETIDILLGELHGKELDATKVFPDEIILVRDYPGLHLHWNWRFQPQELRDRVNATLEQNNGLQHSDIRELLRQIYQQTFEKDGFLGGVGLWGSLRAPTASFTPSLYLLSETVLKKSNQLDFIPRFTGVDDPTYRPYVFDINSTRSRRGLNRIDIATGISRRDLYDDRERLMHSIEQAHKRRGPFEDLVMTGRSQRLVNALRAAVV